MKSFFRRGITWTLVSMNPLFGVRELGKNLTFNKAAATILFNDETIIDYVLGFLKFQGVTSTFKNYKPDNE